VPWARAAGQRANNVPQKRRNLTWIFIRICWLGYLTRLIGISVRRVQKHN
jgi:hypothetical protein